MPDFDDVSLQQRPELRETSTEIPKYQYVDNGLAISDEMWYEAAGK